MSSNSSKKIEERLRERKRQYWEGLKRKPEYKKLYDKYSKAKRHDAKRKWNLCIIDRFSVFPINYSNDFNDSIADDILIGECYYIIPGTNYKRDTNFDFRTIPSNKILNNVIVETRQGKRSEFLFGGRYLRLELDITQPWEYCVSKAKLAITNAQNKLSKDVYKFTERPRKDDFDTQIKAFDLKTKGISHKKIGEQLWPSDLGDSEQKSKNAVKKITDMINLL